VAVDIASACDTLADEYMRVLASLGSLPVGGSYSEGGRSISATASELQARLKMITDQMAMLGCPVGTIGDPFVITSRARP
jgi:predicted alpha/beta-hydrolase family hydrolase